MHWCRSPRQSDHTSFDLIIVGEGNDLNQKLVFIIEGNNLNP